MATLIIFGSVREDRHAGLQVVGWMEEGEMNLKSVHVFTPRIAERPFPSVWTNRLFYSRRPAVALLALVLILSTSSTVALADVPWSSGWPQGESNAAITTMVTTGDPSHMVYASTSEGLYGSSDGGESWSVLSTLANISALAVDPTNSAIVYAYCWPNQTGAQSDVRGMRRSVDGGRTWSDPTNGSSTEVMGAVVTLKVDPVDPRVILAGSAYYGGYGKIVRSSDGGKTWQAVYSIAGQMGSGSITALDFCAANHSVVYAGHDTYHGGAVVRSDDNGLTWRMLPSPSVPLSFPAALTIDSSNPNVAFVVWQTLMGGGISIYRTEDGGTSYAKIGNGLPSVGASNPSLVLDPADSNALFVSVQGEGAGVYRSVDRGQSWSTFSTAASLPYSATVLGFSSVSRELYAATKNGVWQTTVPSTIAVGLMEYYNRFDGWRVMGGPISSPMRVDGFDCQYFEKGRLEDHSQQVSDPAWRYMYGLLVDQLQEARAKLPVGGDVSTISYADVNDLSRPEHRLPAPNLSVFGVQPQSDGTVFIPFNAQLLPEAGHSVAAVFWNYINRSDLFPGGWLHDIGLPTTEPVTAVVDKGTVKSRQILIQAFQRTILTYDPLNPTDWQVERANVGTDFAKQFPELVQ